MPCSVYHDWKRGYRDYEELISADIAIIELATISKAYIFLFIID